MAICALASAALVSGCSSQDSTAQSCPSYTVKLDAGTDALGPVGQPGGQACHNYCPIDYSNCRLVDSQTVKCARACL